MSFKSAFVYFGLGLIQVYPKTSAKGACCNSDIAVESLWNRLDVFDLMALN